MCDVLPFKFYRFYCACYWFYFSFQSQFRVEAIDFADPFSKMGLRFEIIMLKLGYGSTESFMFFWGGELVRFKSSDISKDLAVAEKIPVKCTGKA